MSFRLIYVYTNLFIELCYESRRQIYVIKFLRLRKIYFLHVRYLNIPLAEYNSLRVPSGIAK